MSTDNSIEMNTVFRQTNDLMSSDLEGDTVLMSVESGAYYGLEATGQVIWALLAQPIQVCDLVDRLLDRYCVERSTCENQVIAFLSKLETEGLIQRCSSTDASPVNK